VRCRSREGCFGVDQLQQRIHHNSCLVRPVSVNRHLSDAGVGCNLIHTHCAEATLCDLRTEKHLGKDSAEGDGFSSKILCIASY
jgi:hypothetical protein